MKSLKYIFAGALAIAALTACQNEEEQSAADVYAQESYYAGLATIGSTDPDFTSTEEGGTVTFKAAGGSVVVNVDCGTDWIAENHGSDVFDVVASASAGTLTITAPKNTVDEEINASITLETSGSLIEFATITLFQAASGAPEIEPETNEWNAPAFGTLTKEIAVDCSIDDYNISVSEDWLTAEKTDAGISLTAEENDGEEYRSAKVQLTCTDGTRAAYANIAVTQDPKVYLNLSSTKVVTSVYGETASVTAESNYEWSFSYDESIDWLTVEHTTTGLTVTTAASESKDDRIAEVTFTAGDGLENTVETVVTITQAGAKSLIITCTVLSTSATTVTIPLNGTVECSVDWGDGSEIETVTSALPTHDYASTGTYDIKVDGTVTSLYDKSSDTMLTGVKQWGLTGLTSMNHAFYKCTSFQTIPGDTFGSFAEVTDFTDAFTSCTLTSIPADLFAYGSKIENFDYCFWSDNITTVPVGLFDKCTAAKSFRFLFYQCYNLTTIPAGLFDNCTEVTTFEAVFSWCRALESIPKGLFDHNTKNTSFAQVFYYCEPIKEIPEGLFDNCPEVTSFYYAFSNCYAIEKIPEGLFDNNTKVTDMSTVFQAMYGITEVPENIFAKNTAVTTFKNALRDCRNLTSVPANLFANNTAVTDFSYVFYNCISLKEIPAGIFANNTKATTFSYAFNTCTSLTSVPEGLLSNTAASTVLSMFNGCSALTSVPEDLFANHTSIVSFVSVFNGCSSLTSIPENIFADNTKATLFTSAFYGCTNLKSIPAGLFANNTAVTGFGNIFRNCTSLTSVPDGLFANNTKVTTFTYAFSGCTNLTHVPSNIFDNNMKVTIFSYAFQDCTAWAEESPYTELTVNGSTVKVHLYDRNNYSTELDASTVATVTKCFQNCTKLTDYDAITAAGWN